ncbi:hypothetical protein AGLY_010442 [Aphis glycines]|uniref:Uncharacterized protein n=1 Tax=Aphis glycines TaxID=307491 RepID=A0A6G0TDK0_APHGL|nr:hypothetical protein AGLY_010442 [Aphis glycines]
MLYLEGILKVLLKSNIKGGNVKIEYHTFEIIFPPYENVQYTQQFIPSSLNNNIFNEASHQQTFSENVEFNYYVKNTNLISIKDMQWRFSIQQESSVVNPKMNLYLFINGMIILFKIESVSEKQIQMIDRNYKFLLELSYYFHITIGGHCFSCLLVYYHRFQYLRVIEKISYKLNYYNPARTRIILLHNSALHYLTKNMAHSNLGSN